MSDSHVSDDARAAVRAYHQQSKHSFERYAPGPASLDWDAQPDPFRHFAGCGRIELPLSADRIDLPFSALNDPGAIPGQSLGSDSIGRLLELSLAVSAWKSLGAARWAVRCNPSSGNLHPVEAYLVLPESELGSAGLYHYEAKEHLLEQRCAFDEDLAGRLSALLPPGCLLVGLSLVPWREAWKYGVRAWRYCQLDLGHAIGALGYAAACNGWQMRSLADWSLGEIGRLLGLDRSDDFEPDEPEYPAGLLMLGPEPAKLRPQGSLLDALTAQHWHGKANRLDPRHLYRWDAVDEMARLIKPPAGSSGPAAENLSALQPAPGEPPAAEVIRRRRSARAFDPRLGIDSGMFYRLLDGCRPRPGTPPWDKNQGRSPLHLLLFVHRVEGLAPGLYLLGADRHAAEALCAIMRPEFTWERPPGCPGDLPSHHLISANARTVAMQLGCHQQICAQSAFALAMLGEFDTALNESEGGYDMLLREAGRIGQALYLNAEAEGIGSSGIGCFFDDPIHEMFGLQDQRLQTLYMFTVGPAMEERGLIDLPAYPRQRQGMPRT
ncbi:MAG: nitroreductase family protein [Pseudomonadota bacterium]|nr:nitroreductase family protein [Pseudomonadota bacterium]